MKKDLYELADMLSEQDCEPFEKNFEDIADSAEISDEQKRRILSSVMRKAGHEMNDNTMYGASVIRMQQTKKEDKKEETVRDTDLRARHGGLAAACIAFLLVGSAGAVMLLHGGTEIQPPKQSPATQLASLAGDSSEEDKKMAQIPDVVGMEEAEACQKLLEAGFKPVKRETYADTVKAGIVIKTEPESSSELLEEGTEVIYYVSKGPLDERSVETAAPDSQSPEETETSADETTVTEVIPDQTEPAETEPAAEQVTVPDLVGYTRNRATAILDELGLGYEIQKTNKGKNGTVMEQSIAPDTVVDKGSMITLYVSAGDPEFVEMTMEIPIPKGAKGCYIIDVYREGSIAYTMTIEDASKYAGSTITLDIAGIAQETLTVYAKKFDAGYDNYVRYATYNVDYDTKTAELKGELNEKDFIDPPKAWDD